MATRKNKTETNNESVLTQQHEGPLTIGIDLGDRISHYCILNGNGDILREGRLQSTPASIPRPVRILAGHIGRFGSGNSFTLGEFVIGRCRTQSNRCERQPSPPHSQEFEKDRQG
jgi:hypothetical protein